MASPTLEVASVTIAKKFAIARSAVLAWHSKVVLAVLDQGLMSGSNFVIGILLARWLTSEQYGAYALAFSIFLLLSQFYTALLLEPMAVFGGAIYRNRLRGYMGSLLWMHVGTSIMVAFLLGIAALVAMQMGSGGNLPSTLAAVTVASPCLLVFWLVRRGFYLYFRPARAVLGALFYCVLVLGGLVLVYRHGTLSALMAFVLMAAGALATSLVSLMQLKPTLRLEHADPGLRETCWQHWDYGRWALGAAALIWIPSNIYFLVLSSFSGLADAGVLKALANLSLPISNIATAVSLLFQPYASRIHDQRGVNRVRAFTRNISFLYAGGAAAYWSVLVLFRRQILHLLYGGNYAGLEGLVPWLAVGSILQLALAGPTIALRAMESPASVFWVSMASSVVAVLIGIPLAWAFGIRGVVISMAASSLMGLVVAYALLKRKAGNSAAEVMA